MRLTFLNARLRELAQEGLLMSLAIRTALRILLFLEPLARPQELAQDRLLRERAILPALRILLSLALKPFAELQERVQDRLLRERAILPALRILPLLGPLARPQGHAREAKSSREFAIRDALREVVSLRLEEPLARPQELALGVSLEVSATPPALLTPRGMGQNVKQADNVRMLSIL